MLKLSLIIVVGLFIFFGILIACAFEDNEITTGEGYGFTIGMTKRQAYDAAKSLYAGKTIYMLNLLDERGKTNNAHLKFDFAEDQLSQIESRDVWNFFFKKNFLSALRLTFEDGRLISIYRHKKLTELP